MAQSSQPLLAGEPASSLARIGARIGDMWRGLSPGTALGLPAQEHKSCLHCWHVTPGAETHEDIRAPEVCCWCQSRRRWRRELPAHGPYAPPADLQQLHACDASWT